MKLWAMVDYSLWNCRFAHAIDIKRRHNANDQGTLVPLELQVCPCHGCKEVT